MTKEEAIAYEILKCNVENITEEGWQIVVNALLKVRKKEDDCVLTCDRITEAYKQGRQDALREAEERVKAYGAVWMAYTEAMTKEQIAQEALNSAKEAMLQILEQLKEKQ